VSVLTQQGNATNRAIDSIVDTLQSLQRSIHEPTEPALATHGAAPVDKDSQSATSVIDDLAETFSDGPDFGSQTWLNGGTVIFPFEGSVSHLADCKQTTLTTDAYNKLISELTTRLTHRQSRLISQLCLMPRYRLRSNYRVLATIRHL
jgi:hypothetical protein